MVSHIIEGQRSEHCQNKKSKKKFKYEIHTNITNTNVMNEICENREQAITKDDMVSLIVEGQQSKNGFNRNLKKKYRYKIHTSKKNTN